MLGGGALLCSEWLWVLARGVVGSLAIAHPSILPLPAAFHASSPELAATGTHRPPGQGQMAKRDAGLGGAAGGAAARTGAGCGVEDERGEGCPAPGLGACAVPWPVLLPTASDLGVSPVLSWH